ncbi:hypothetical protein B0H13DRAFT_2324432 [Mycena leptocephala]|nr:hypothetical protein B0H13DRAFT_2324432 [Mycena leptocephala]
MVFEVAYPDPTVVDLVPPCISDFAFDSRYQPAFTLFTTFSIASGEGTEPIVSHMAADTSSASLRQPTHSPLSWGRFETIITYSELLTTLVLDGVHFADVPAGVFASSPLFNLGILDVRFRGILSMTQRFGALTPPPFIPSFSDATPFRIFRISSHACMHMQLGSSIFASSLANTVVLDLHDASLAAFNSFSMACNAVAHYSANNWRAGPKLEELRVREVALTRLVDLVCARLDPISKAWLGEEESLTMNIL